MNDTRDMQRLLAEWLAESAPDGAPDEAVENAITTTSQQRPRPAWLTMLRTPPMTTQRHAMVGSPTARLMYLATVLLLATAIATAGLVAGAQLAARADEPASTNGLIAFDSEGDIWVADPDGSNVRRLTNDPALEKWPYWSPDGTSLAFLVEAEPGRHDLVVMDAAGGDRVVAARGLVQPILNHQGWSPDGTKLAYSNLGEGGTFNIFVAQADGSGTQQVGDPEMLARDPAFSPDGRSIAFNGGSGAVSPVEPTDRPKRGVYVMDADGSNTRLVSQVDGSGYAFSMPLWSPDGSLILTYAGSDGGHKIWFFRADGRGDTQVSLDGIADDFWATWSPDGTRIAYDHHSRGVQLAFFDIEGGHTNVLEEPAIDRWEPVWSPDGTRVIAHLGPDGGGNDLGIIDPTGKAAMVVIEAPSPGNVSWQPTFP